MRLKKSVKRFLIFFVIVAIGGVCAFYYFHGHSSHKVKVVSSIPGYGYQLKDNKSPQYKKLFRKLKTILDEDPVDEKKYVKTISKMFILDFYSLKEKLAKTDVGGVDFVHSDALVDFLEKSEDTIYKYVESNLYGGRTQSLPNVSEVTVKSVSVEPFVYHDTTDEEASVVKVTWKYKNKSASSGYQKSATLTFVHEDKKLSLVELK